MWTIPSQVCLLYSIFYDPLSMTNKNVWSKVLEIHYLSTPSVFLYILLLMWNWLLEKCCEEHLKNWMILLLECSTDFQIDSNIWQVNLLSRIQVHEKGCYFSFPIILNLNKYDLRALFILHKLCCYVGWNYVCTGKEGVKLLKVTCTQMNNHLLRLLHQPSIQ